VWGGRQFGYRDAGHYYYPLYERVEAEWQAGRVPLWEPGENAGAPLLGNPAAAVLYPGKIVYALFPYPLAARLYVVAHTILAFLAMWVLLRSWGASAVASALAGLGYAFGAPVLFQYCNVIYLVGAAWTPLGFHAADRWLRREQRTGLLELAVVLALLVLGGDPESAYVLGVAALGYAVGLTWTRAQTQARPGWGRKLGARVAGLAAAAALAFALAAAQLLPALEFIAQTNRAEIEAPHDVYPFSLEPVRVIELVWPNVFGTSFAGNRSWLEATRPGWAQRTRIWVPSLYLGGLVPVLALGAFGFRNRDRAPTPGRGWLTAVALISFAASLGEFTGPLCWARCFRVVAARLGPHDSADTDPIRRDGHYRDGDGGIYWMLTTALPGFRQFRYPSKLLSYAALATAGLAGLGWDRLAAGAGRRRTAAAAAVLLALGLIALVGVILGHHTFVAALRASPAAKLVSMSGPLDAEGAFRALCRALVHGSLVLVIALALLRLLAVRPGGGRGHVLAGILALLTMTADLALANAGLVLTVPQALLDAEPEALKAIARAEEQSARDHPEENPPGPFRVHRMKTWFPARWSREPGADRISESVAWEHASLRPKYGLLHGLAYTTSFGVADLPDYQGFFGTIRRPVDATMAKRLGVRPGQPVVVQSRRAFDLWNTRYFVLPADPKGWNDETRACAALVTDVEPIYPPADAFPGPEGDELRRRWAEREDFVVYRNRAAYPRAWVVHDAQSLGPPLGTAQATRTAALRAILENGDPRRTAWLDADTISKLNGYLPGTRPEPSEQPTIAQYGPQQIAIEVTLKRPGLMVLADTFYPGWTLTIDGVNAEIHRVNLMMRGAAVRAGKHELVYRYEPVSFRAGVALSIAGLILLTLGAFTSRHSHWPPGPR
jgi:hypothetical protein